MNKIESAESEKEFLAHPAIIENYDLLQEIGVFAYIDSLNREILNYKSLVAGALEIFNQTSIDEIMNAAVWQISDHFLPSFLVFILKPLENKDDIVTKCYKNYKPADMSLDIETIAPFTPFFRSYRQPISYDLLKVELECANVFETLDPEIVIPILGPSGLYGMVLVGRKMLDEEYSIRELAFFQELMSFVSQSLQNHLHYERTLRDVKTGLFNNGFFLTRLNDEVARVQRSNTSASVIIIDVDKFKNFNDSYGHLAGDRVLEYLALAIKQGVRAEDIPSRFGGEEFTVLLPNSDGKAAWIVAERLRQAVSNMKIPWETPLPQVTISLGICAFTKDTKLDAPEIVKRADEAMYLSKERGRNRTTVWGSGLMAKIELLKLSKL